MAGFSTQMRRAFLGIACCFLLAAPAAAQGGVAANQLCSAAGLGAGCIGTVTPHAMPGGGGVPGMSNMMGGMLTSIGFSLLMNALQDSATENAAATAAVAPAAPPPNAALQQAIQQQQRFDEERQSKLLASLTDMPDLQLIGSDVGESASMQARCGFDTGGGCWNDLFDAWYSPDASQALGAQPIAVSDQAMSDPATNSQPLDCMATMGSQLCSFPPTSNPAVTLHPATAPPPPPLTEGVRLAGNTPANLSTGGIGDDWAYRTSIYLPRAPAPGQEECKVELVDSDKLEALTLRSDLRERFHPPSIQQRIKKLGDKIQKMRDDPQEDAEVMVSFLADKQQMPWLQGLIAGWGRDAYKIYTGQALCLVGVMLNKAASGDFEGAIESSDQVMNWLANGRGFSVGKVAIGAYLDVLHDIEKDNVLGPVDDAIDTVKGQVKEQLVSWGDNWLSGGKGQTGLRWLLDGGGDAHGAAPTTVDPGLFR